MTVERSIIGQQPALNQAGTTNQFLSTIAPRGTQRGTGQIADNLTMNIFDVDEGNDGNIPATVTPRRNQSQQRRERPTPPVDGRRTAQRRRVNLHVNNEHFIPPSSRASGGGFNISALNRGLENLQSGVQAMMMMDRIRPIHQINRDILQASRDRQDLRRSGGSQEDISSLDEFIENLISERTRSTRFDDYLFNNVNDTQE